MYYFLYYTALHKVQRTGNPVAIQQPWYPYCGWMRSKTGTRTDYVRRQNNPFFITLFICLIPQVYFMVSKPFLVSFLVKKLAKSGSSSTY